MSNDITAAELKAWRKEEGMTQTELGEMIGWDKYAVTSIETGRRNISDAEQRLLKLLIRGEAPFETQRGPWDPQIQFSEQEWALMTKIALREGYHSARSWIVAKIRGYLAMAEPARFEAAAALLAPL